MHLGEWRHSLDHDEPCRVVDTEVPWSQPRSENHALMWLRCCATARGA